MHIVLVGKPEGKRSLYRRRYRWENIKIDLKDVGRRAWTEGWFLEKW
jgi:hypothetical protein